MFHCVFPTFLQCCLWNDFSFSLTRRWPFQCGTWIELPLLVTDYVHLFELELHVAYWKTLLSSRGVNIPVLLLGFPWDDGMRLVFAADNALVTRTAFQLHFATLISARTWSCGEQGIIRAKQNKTNTLLLLSPWKRKKKEKEKKKKKKKKRRRSRVDGGGGGGGGFSNSVGRVSDRKARLSTDAVRFSVRQGIFCHSQLSVQTARPLPPPPHPPLVVFAQPPCAIACLGFCAHVKNPKHWQTLIVWTHETTAHNGGTALANTVTLPR